MKIIRPDFLPNPYTPLLVVISGPSGVGKDSALIALKSRNLDLHFVVTATDRAKRPGEVDGVDYHFYTTAQFEAMMANHEFVEYAVVYNQYKGVPRFEIEGALASGQDVVLRVDVQGAAKLRQLYPQCVQIFLVPASLEEMERRLIERGTDTPEQIAKRFETIRKELDAIPQFDYAVVNPDRGLDCAVDQIVGIIQSEHLRTIPRKIEL